MVDVYEIAPHDKSMHAAAAAPYAYAGQEARMARYQNLLSKLSHDELATAARVDWEAADDDNIEMQGNTLPVKAEATEPLVGDFADAAAAMR